MEGDSDPPPPNPVIPSSTPPHDSNLAFAHAAKRQLARGHGAAGRGALGAVKGGLSVAEDGALGGLDADGPPASGAGTGEREGEPAVTALLSARTSLALAERLSGPNACISGAPPMTEDPTYHTWFTPSSPCAAAASHTPGSCRRCRQR
uniref:Uncharacterized protein n=1 Tax=Setaria viridis TaxID=4556 RepID=A0A4U6UEX3_SETVI|nr:hypothetical protein SEVIR_5G048966v2 [Setaria viridis]